MTEAQEHDLVFIFIQEILHTVALHVRAVLNNLPIVVVSVVFFNFRLVIIIVCRFLQAEN